MSELRFNILALFLLPILVAFIGALFIMLQDSVPELLEEALRQMLIFVFDGLYLLYLPLAFISAIFLRKFSSGMRVIYTLLLPFAFPAVLLLIIGIKQGNPLLRAAYTLKYGFHREEYREIITAWGLAGMLYAVCFIVLMVIGKITGVIKTNSSVKNS